MLKPDGCGVWVLDAPETLAAEAQGVGVKTAPEELAEKLGGMRASRRD